MNPNRFAMLSQRVFNTPLAISPGKAEIITAALAERMGISRLMRADGSAVPVVSMMHDWDGGSPRQPPPEEVCGYCMIGGLAVIDVHGTLVQRNYCLRPYSGMTGYDGLRVSLANALSDTNVHGIVLDIDSPGGECAGLFDLADAFYAARAVKPLVAVLTEQACSAAYLLAASTSRVYIPRTGMAGSIGAIAMMVEFSRALDAAGVTVNLLQYGTRKADGQDVIPLADEGRARFQAMVNGSGEMIVNAVAQYRGLDAGLVRATEGAVLTANEALQLGLVDVIASPEAAIAEIRDELGLAQHAAAAA